MIGEFFIVNNKIRKHVEKIFTNKKDTILDIGSGKKPRYHRWAKGHIVCFDITKYKKTDVVGDADFLPFKKDSFDKVVSVNAFYYFKSPVKVIENVSMILRKNGVLVMVTPFIYPIHDVPHDKYRFTEYGLREMLKENFTVREIKAIGGIFNLPAVLFHALIKGLPLLFPKAIRSIVGFFSTILLYPFYIVAQIFSILGAFDRTRRWPTYYLTVAVKK